MRIVVAGTINHDILSFSDGETVDTLGGLAYSILTLAELMPREWAIFPVANVGYDIYGALLDILRKYDNINLSGLREVHCPNNAVHLTLLPGEERDEYAELNLPPLEFHNFQGYLDCDALILNFTSGFDLDLSTAQSVKTACAGLVYIDIHSLTLGIDENKHRFRRKLNDWRDWIEGADFVQLTSDEAWSFHPDDDFGPDAIHEIGHAVADRIKQACLMTMGAEGVRVFTGDGASHYVKAEPVSETVDTTGCGDVFGAAFLVKYLEAAILLSSVDFATKTAAKKCRFIGIDDLGKLKL